MANVQDALNSLISIRTSPLEALNTSLNAFGTAMRTSLEWNKQMQQKEATELNFLDSLIAKETNAIETLSQLELAYYKEKQANSRFYSGLAHQEKMADKRFGQQLALTKYIQSQANYRAKLAYNKALQTATIRSKSNSSSKSKNSTNNYTVDLIEQLVK